MRRLAALRRRAIRHQPARQAGSVDAGQDDLHCSTRGLRRSVCTSAIRRARRSGAMRADIRLVIGVGDPGLHPTPPPAEPSSAAVGSRQAAAPRHAPAPAPRLLSPSELAQFALMYCAVRSASAAVEICGGAPSEVGKTLMSQTNRFGSSCDWQYELTTARASDPRPSGRCSADASTRSGCRPGARRARRTRRASRPARAPAAACTAPCTFVAPLAKRISAQCCMPSANSCCSLRR